MNGYKPCDKRKNPIVSKIQKEREKRCYFAGRGEEGKPGITLSGSEVGAAIWTSRREKDRGTRNPNRPIVVKATAINC